MLTGFDKLANNDIPNAIKPLQDAVNNLNTKMVQIATSQDISLKNIINTQNKIQGIIQKALIDEFGNVTLKQRLDENDKNLKKLGELLQGTGINIGFNEELNKKLDEVFKKAGTSPQEISALNKSLSDTQKNIKSINTNLFSLNLKVEQLTNSKDAVDPALVNQLKTENFALTGQITFLKEEKIKLEKQVNDITEKITKSSQDIETLQASLANAGNIANAQNKEAQAKIAEIIRQKTEEALKFEKDIKNLKEILEEENSDTLNQENEGLKTQLEERIQTINDLFQGKGTINIFTSALTQLQNNARDIEVAKNFIKQMPLFNQLGGIKALANKLQAEMDLILFKSANKLRKNKEKLDRLPITTIDKPDKKKTSESINKEGRSIAINQRRNLPIKKDEEIKEEIKEETTTTTTETITKEEVKEEEIPPEEEEEEEFIVDKDKQEINKRLVFNDLFEILDEEEEEEAEEEIKKEEVKQEVKRTPQFIDLTKDPVFIDLTKKSKEKNIEIKESFEKLAEVSKEASELIKLKEEDNLSQSDAQKLRRRTEELTRLTAERNRLFNEKHEIEKEILKRRQEISTTTQEPPEPEPTPDPTPTPPAPKPKGKLIRRRQDLLPTEGTRKSTRTASAVATAVNKELSKKGGTLLK
jgi:predicted  nucleic acid-binding Zn-ribbon protein